MKLHRWRAAGRSLYCNLNICFRREMIGNYGELARTVLNERYYYLQPFTLSRHPKWRWISGSLKTLNFGGALSLHKSWSTRGGMGNDYDQSGCKRLTRFKG